MTTVFSGSVPVAQYDVRSLVGIPVPVFDRPKEPRQIVVNIDWSTYGVGLARPSQGVAINIVGGVQASIIDKIRGVAIDNTNSYVTVYVVFEDGYVATCPPFTSVFTPVITSSTRATVYAQYFTGQTPVPQTTVRFLNVAANPFGNPEFLTSRVLYRQSPIFGATQINQSDLGIPGIGDRVSQTQVLASGANSTTIFAASPGNFAVLNSVVLTGFGLVSSLNATLEISFRENAVPVTNLFTWRAGVATGVFNGITPIYSVHGVNIKISLAHEWLLINDGSLGLTSGNALLHLVYTTTNS